MRNDGESRSHATSADTEQLLEFTDFLQTLEPELRARYQASHYKLRDIEDTPIKRKWKDIEATEKKQNVYQRAQRNFEYDGIPPEYEDALALPYNWYRKLRCLFLVSAFPFVQAGSLVSGTFGVHLERFHHLVSFPYVIHPHSNFYWMWNFFSCTILLYSLTYEPYVIAFDLPKYSLKINRILSFTVSFIMMLDTILMFRVGYMDTVTTKMILDPIVIGKDYIRCEFWFNLISRFPHDSIMFLFIAPEHRVVKTQMTWIRLVAFTSKVMRYDKLSKFMRWLTVSFKMDTWSTQIILHGILVVFCGHWGACLHWLLPDVVNAYYFEIYGTYKRDSWITRMGNLWNSSADFQYMNAFLRGLGNVLSLDGGDFCPIEYEEIFVTAVLIILSLSIVSYYISTFSSMVVEFQKGDDQLIEMTACVLEYMRFRKIPPWLKERVLAYYDGKYKGLNFPEHLVLGTISGNMKNEILQHNCRGLIEEVYLFSELPNSVMQNLVQRLTYEVYIPGDVVQSPHIKLQSIFFIEEGHFGVLDEFGDCIQLLEHGDFFGEIDLLFPAIPRTTSIVTLSTSNVYKLSKKEYWKCMTLFPEVHAKISAIATQKLEKEVQQLDKQLEKIAHAQQWKQLVLRKRRTFEEYYAEMDAGIIPAHHIPPTAMQLIHYENYKRSKRYKQSQTDSRSRSRWSRSDSAFTTDYSSRDTSSIWSHSP